MTDALKRSFKPYERHLTAMRERMLETLHQLDDRNAVTVADGFLEGGGHMLRPTVCALVYGIVRNDPGEQPEDQGRLHCLGAAIELLHNASLIHDDVLDGSETRRGQPALNQGMGNHGAVLMGNLFYLSAFRLILQLEDRWYANRLIRTAESMCIGEVRQKHHEGSVLTEAEYLDIIERKTGRLVAAASELSARLAGGTEEEMAFFREFGLLAGILYQLKDDAEDRDVENLPPGIAPALKARKSEEMRFLLNRLKAFPAGSMNRERGTLAALTEYLMEAPV